MAIKKDVYITFYEKYGDVLAIHNDFSFGRENTGVYTDIFISREASTKDIQGQLKVVPHQINRVFVSIKTKEELRSIFPLIDDNWIFTGNSYSYLCAGESEIPDFMDMFGKLKTCNLPSTNFESFLKGTDSPYSSTFDYYFHLLIEKVSGKQLMYNCVLGQGCFWNKCTHCCYKISDKKIYARNNVPAILKHISPNTMSGTSQVRIELPCVDPQKLRDILTVDWGKSLCPIISIRPEPQIIKTLESFDPKDNVCMKKKISLGVEILSDKALNILNKGTSVDSILKTIELLLSHGAMIQLDIMKNFPFLDREIVQEAVEGCKRLKELYHNYDGPSNYVWFLNNGDVLWPSEEVLSHYTDNYERLCRLFRTFGEDEAAEMGYDLYRAVIPENSDIFGFNKMIDEAVLNIGIKLL